MSKTNASNRGDQCADSGNSTPTIRNNPELNTRRLRHFVRELTAEFIMYRDLPHAFHWEDEDIKARFAMYVNRCNKILNSTK